MLPEPADRGGPPPYGFQCLAAPCHHCPMPKVPLSYHVAWRGGRTDSINSQTGMAGGLFCAGAVAHRPDAEALDPCVGLEPVPAAGRMHPIPGS